MNIQEISVAELLDRFDQNTYKLIFLESALRGMIHTGNIGEAFVSEGLSNVLLSMIKEQKSLQDDFQKILRSPTIAATVTVQQSLTTHGKDEKT